MSALRMAERATALALFGIAALLAPRPVGAQAEAWADQNYRYRRPLVIENTAGASIATGDVLALSFVPGYGPFDGKAGTKDVRIYYQPDAQTVVDVPQVLLDMGANAAKILFAVRAPVPAGSPQPYVRGTDSSTYQETGVALGMNANDDVRTVALPFNFPFLGSVYNQMTVSTNGWVAFEPGLADPHYGDPQGTASLKSDLQKRRFIAPLGYDLDTSPYISGADVFYNTSVTGQVTVRWKADAYTDSSARAARLNFSVTLFQDGRIRMNYGTIATIVNSQRAPYGFAMGIATGSLRDDLLIETGVPYDLGSHASILFTPNTPSVSAATGYWLYYGNAADTGARTSPDSAHLTAYSFDTDAQGWIAASGNLDTLAVSQTTLPTGENVLQVVPSTSTGRPSAIAAEGPDLADQTLYAKLRPSDGGIGIAARAAAGNQSYALLMSDLSGLDGAPDKQAGIIVRTSPPGTALDYTMLSPHNTFASSGLAWDFAVLKVTGSGSGIDLQGRVFHSGGVEPRGFQYEALPADPAIQFASGKVGLTGSGGGSAGPLYVDWVYAVPNGFAERVSVQPGPDSAEQQAPPPPGKATLKGTVTDAATLAVVPGISVTAVASGGPTLSLPPTDSAGAYFAYVDPGQYAVSFSSPGYTAQTVPAALAAGDVRTLDVSLVAPELVTNGGMETPDAAAPTVKPLGWYRRNYVSDSPAPNPTAEVYAPGWRYSAAQAHSGTHSVVVRGPFLTGAGILAWEQEGSVAGSVNTDNRGHGPMIPLVPGSTVRVSSWVKKTVDSGFTAGGSAVLRLRPDLTADDPSTPDFTSSGAEPSLSGVFDWTPLAYDFTVPSSLAGHYLQIRLYGTSLPDGNSVFWDDISAHRVQFPVFRGVLHTSPDTDGVTTPLAGFSIGVREAGANGLASPIATTTTDDLGRWSVSFEPVTGREYVVQAYPDRSATNTHTAVSANVPLAQPPALTEIVYDPSPVIDIALQRPVVAYSSEQGGNDPSSAFDDAGTQWQTDGTTPAGSTPRGYDKPQFVVIDLGQDYDFGKIAQIVMLTTSNRPDHYQYRVSMTPPPTDPNQFTAAEAAAYGTLLYDSPHGAGTRFHNTPGFDAYTDIVSAPNLRPVYGRYFEVYMDAYTGFSTNFSIYELKVEAYPVKVTGKVVDPSGSPVSEAVVGQHPDGTSYAMTDATGTYDLSLAYGGSYVLRAHKGSTAATVQPLSSPGSLSPYPGGTGPTLVLGPPVANLVASTASDRPDLNTTPSNPPSAAGDKDFTTRWETNQIVEAPGVPAVDSNNPLRLTADLGTTQPVNLVVINWVQDVSTTHQVDASQIYSVEVSTDNSTFYQVYRTDAGNGGYDLALPDGGRLIDAIDFPIRNARYVRLTLTGHLGDYLGLWELQVGKASVPTTPLEPADAQRALQIVAGFTAATALDVQRLSHDGTSPITLNDAVRIYRTIVGL